MLHLIRGNVFWYKQGFQVFLFVSRTLWVVLGSGMDWRVRCFSLAGLTPYCGLCKFLHSLGFQQCLNVRVIFINVPFTQVWKWLQNYSLRGLVTVLQMEKYLLNWELGSTGSLWHCCNIILGSLALPNEDKPITPCLWKPLAVPHLVFAVAQGWPKPGSCCCCHPTASQQGRVGSKALPKVRFSTYLWNLVGNKRVFLGLPCSIQDFWQHIQHSQGCCGKRSSQVRLPLLLTSRLPCIYPLQQTAINFAINFLCSQNHARRSIHWPVPKTLNGPEDHKAGQVVRNAREALHALVNFSLGFFSHLYVFHTHRLCIQMHY